MSETITRSQVEDFLYREARLLDDHQFEEWLELFDDEALYWAPQGRNDIDPNREVSLIYDDRTRMGQRVQRVLSGQAHSQDPLSVTRRVVGNVEILNQDGPVITVTSNFIIAELRPGLQTIYAGRYEHVIDTSKPGWRILKKKVELINNNEPLGNVSFFL